MPERRRRPRPAAPAVSAAALPAGVVRTQTTTAELRWDSPHHVTLMLGGTEASGLDLLYPERVEFEYMQQMLAALDVLRPGRQPVRAVHLGGAGCALARALEARRPGSTQLAVELDADLARLVREWFDLPRSPRLRIRVGDARAAVTSLTPAAWEVVVRDVFADALVPAHVRTVEMAAEVSRALTDDGVYLVNVTDRPPLREARAEVATLGEVFPHVAVVADPAILRGRRYGNVVILARREPLPTGELDRALRRLPLPVRLVHGSELADFAGAASAWRDPATDDDGPVPSTGTGPSH